MLHDKLFNLKGTWAKINLNDEFKRFDDETLRSPACNPVWCADMVKKIHIEKGVDFSYGGFLEYRGDVWRGHYMSKTSDYIHVGVDYNVPIGTEVIIPADGILLLAELDVDRFGGWGGRMIFHMEDENSIPKYVEFAHMFDMNTQVGEYYEVGDTIGFVADDLNNGGWYPHLHVQVMDAYWPNCDGYTYNIKHCLNGLTDPEEIIKW